MSGVVNIRGKQYSTVAKRITDFREAHPIDAGWGIVTELVHRDEATVVMRAAVVSPEGNEVAVGYAEEDRNASKINKSSALENAETSAVGRALAAAGLGGGQYASAEEVAIAIAKQEATEAREQTKRWTRAQQGAFFATLKDIGVGYEHLKAWCAAHNRPKPSVMPHDQRKRLVKWLRDEDGANTVNAWGTDAE